jgi:hypothetical protein
MAKRPSTRKATPSGKLDPQENLNIDLTKFKPDLTSDDLKKILTPVKLANVNLIIFPTIETISPVKTVGLGRTNLTLVRPITFQTDAIPPHASFNLQNSSPQQPPTVSVHFEPGKYGLTASSVYIMSFSIEVFGSATFTLGAFAGAGIVTGTGSRTVSGKQTVSITFKNVPPTQETFGHISQTGGSPWNWFQTRISYLPILITA